MSYKQAMEAAGITVLAYREFGYYQGEWVAKVRMPDGTKGFIHDWFGSCTVCDAFQSDVGWEPWDDDEDEVAAYNAKVKQFGERYLGTCMTPEALLDYLEPDLEWDETKVEMAEWVKQKVWEDD